MYVRSRIDGTPLRAELDLRPTANGRPQFVLVLHDRAGHRQVMDRLSASIGYELIQCSREDLAALILAGFHLPRAGRLEHPRLSRLVDIIRAARKNKPRRAMTPHRKEALRDAVEDRSSWYMIVEHSKSPTKSSRPGELVTTQQHSRNRDVRSRNAMPMQ